MIGPTRAALEAVNPERMQASACLQSIDRARLALARARDDYERVRVRDAARVVILAAGVLERRDIQVEAANLVADAERAIARANPPRSSTSSSGITGPLSGDSVRQIRRAHAGVSDEAFEALKARAVEWSQPLTRAAVLRAGQDAAREADLERSDQGAGPGLFEVIVVSTCDVWAVSGMALTWANLAEVKLPAAPDCDVFVWVLPKRLPHALRLVRAWGLRYRGLFSWLIEEDLLDPPLIGAPGEPAPNGELLVWASAGHPVFRSTREFYMGFRGPAPKVGQGPDEFYETLARVTVGRRIILGGKARPGFEGRSLRD